MAARKSAVCYRLAACPLQCLHAKTACTWSPGTGMSVECTQKFASQNHIHNGLNQQDLISWGVFLAHSAQCRLKMVVWVLLSRVLIWPFCVSYPLFFSLQADFCLFQKGLNFLCKRWRGGVEEVSVLPFPICLQFHWTGGGLTNDFQTHGIVARFVNGQLIRHCDYNCQLYFMYIAYVCFSPWHMETNQAQI